MPVLPRLIFLALLLCPAVVRALPTPAELRAGYRASEASLLARDGQPLQTLRLDKSVRRLAWTPLGEISPALVRAVIVSEDRRFLSHGGIDWLAAGKAAWSNLRGNPIRGASTLSMQLAGLLEADGRRQGRRSLWGKLTQSGAALRLEGSWSKGEIVEAYLNLVPFRGELQGVGAMSRQLFGKWPLGLDERESALAAALLRGPNAAPEVVARRACQVLSEMQRESECAGLESFAALALNGRLRPVADDAQAALAPHLAQRLLQEPGRALRTSLDADLQRHASTALRQQLSALSRQQVEDGAVLVLDNASGEILAWVGSSGSLSDAPEVDGVSALRQAGSTLKPFLYALALERRFLSPASLIEDAPLSLDTGHGLYTPQNYEPHYRGWVSARMALAGSLNVPAVKTLLRVGTEDFHQRLLRLGFASLKEGPDWYGYSLALGSADVSLLMLANAFRSLANGGQWSPLRLAADGGLIPCRSGGCEQVFTGKPHPVFAATTAFQIADILADPAARAGTFGLESWLAPPYWAAVKTGTSKDMRDNWCIGFSRHYTVAVWVGNASGSPMHDVSGITGAAPVWRSVMDWLQRGSPQQGRPARPSLPPPPPSGLVHQAIRFEPPLEPARQEWFPRGSEVSVIRQVSSPALARIAYPVNASLIALDPDIPPQRQALPLRVEGTLGKGWRWRLDQTLLGPVQPGGRWLPRPGPHALQLEDQRGEVLDRVYFEVRALRGKSGRR